MNPPTFFTYKVEEDPKGSIDEVFKVLNAMGSVSSRKGRTSRLQTQSVAHVWYEQWKDERLVREC